MSERYDVVADSPVGWLGIRCDGTGVTGIDILPEAPAAPPADPTTRPVTDALAAYFAGDRSALDRLSVRLTGTPFQLRVWERLRRIPPGGTLSYGALARELGTSARAVGGACRSNPISLAVPCHRVVAAAGLGGYSGERGGDWLEKKRWLLCHEGAVP